MLRRMLAAAVLAALVGAGLYGWLTAPSVVAASVLPAYQPNLANGGEIING